MERSSFSTPSRSIPPLRIGSSEPRNPVQPSPVPSRGSLLSSPRSPRNGGSPFLASRRSVALQPVQGSVSPPSESTRQTWDARKSDSPAQPVSPRREFLVKGHHAGPFRKTVLLTPLPLHLETDTGIADSQEIPWTAPVSPRQETSTSRQTLGLSKLPPLPETPKATNLSDDEAEGEIYIEILQFERYEVIDLSEVGWLESPRGWHSAEPSPSRRKD